MSMVFEPGNNMFIYENPCCDCKITTNYEDDGTEYHRLLVKVIDGCYKYAYRPVDGLVFIDENGRIHDEKKVIEDFINIDLGGDDGLKTFVDNYGFVMQLPSDSKYKTFDPNSLRYLIEHFRVLVKLISAITDTPDNYDAILKYTIFLLFTEPQYISPCSDEKGLNSCEHSFTKLWYNIDDLPDYKHDLIRDELNGPENDYYLIPDSFTEKKEIFYVESYYDECQFFQESKLIANKLGEQYAENFAQSVGSSLDSQVFRIKITKLYRDAFGGNIDEVARCAIDFFYHLIRHMANKITIQGNRFIRMKVKLGDLSQLDDEDEDDKNFKENFKNALKRLAKYTIKEEFDYVLYNIHPVYNIETMSPQWVIPDFWTALYFALFYMNSKYETYRVCANPACSCLFKVAISNKRTIYHAQSCQNSAAQRRHRIKMKAKKVMEQERSENV